MKPATELPWESHGFMVDSTAVDKSVCDCVTDKNAAYIVHAANAYPKLVEALRALMLECVGSVKYSDWPALQKCVETGDALLVELGEEA